MKNIFIWGRNTPLMTALAHGFTQALTHSLPREVAVIDLNPFPHVTLDNVENYIRVTPPYLPSRVLHLIQAAIENDAVKGIVLTGLCQVWGGEGGVKQISAISRAGWNDPAGERTWKSLLAYMMHSPKPIVAIASARTETTVTPTGDVLRVAMYPEVQPQTERWFGASFLAGEDDTGNARLVETNFDLDTVALGEVLSAETLPLWVKFFAQKWGELSSLLEAVNEPLYYQSGEMVGTNPAERAAFTRFVTTTNAVPADLKTLREWTGKQPPVKATL